MRGETLRSDGQNIVAAQAIEVVPSGSQPELRDDGQHERAVMAKGNLPIVSQSYSGDEGRCDSAEKASRCVPSVSGPPSRSEGHYVADGKSNMMMPNASASNRHAAGHSVSVDETKGKVPSRVSTLREPSEADRRASLVVHSAVAMTIMDTLKIDGRAIGDWTLDEARSVGKEKIRHGYILQSVAQHYANAPGNVRVRDLIKVSDLQRMVQKAAETADAA